jgi:uncharacterized protein
VVVKADNTLVLEPKVYAVLLSIHYNLPLLCYKIQYNLPLLCYKKILLLPIILYKTAKFVYFRNILVELENWRKSDSRKPLILRGARQVGKTTAINIFGKTYAQFISLNLEKPEEADLFHKGQNIQRLVEAIFFLHNKNIQQKADTLLFIDEIQAVPKAISLLRYFYEEIPELHVIAAGSLLETILKENISVPVGRVEYKVLRPVSFDEFLKAVGEAASAEIIKQIPLPEYAQNKLLQLFHSYALIGGMPEAVQHYSVHRDLGALTSIYESILVSYLEDVEKYARNTTMVQIIRHCIRSAFGEAGGRISFQGFGQSNYKSREVAEALRTLEKTLLVKLVYPVTQTQLPLLSDKRKKPRLQVLDTGLMNRFAGLQASLLGVSSLNNIYEGKVAEHIVGQELLARKFNILHENFFWVREKKGAEAEVDFVVPLEDKVIPLEVKNGATGKLKSLHQFMDSVPHTMAVRLYSGTLNVHAAITPNGKNFHLLNLPYYLVSQLDSYLNWFQKQI